jgi:undecaprenyl-diphosphatase
MTDLALRPRPGSGSPSTVSRNTAANVAALLTVAFALLALLVTLRISQVMAFDQWLNRTVVTNRTGWLDQAMNITTGLGARYVIVSLLLVFTGWALLRGRCMRVTALLWAAFLVNPIVEALLKGLVGRPRPDLLQLRPGNGPSFPSGHVLASVGFYGLVAVVLWQSTRRSGHRLAIATIAGALLGGIAASRVYLGVHWPIDAFAGLVIGAVFVVIASRFLKGHHVGADHTCPRAALGSGEPSSLAR